MEQLKFRRQQGGPWPMQKENWFRKNWEKLKEMEVPSAKTIGRVAGIATANTAINKMYGLEWKALEKKADEENANHPKLTKTVKLAVYYGFGIAFARLGSWLSGYIWQELGYTIAFSHPFAISTAVRYIKQKLRNYANGAKEKFQLFKANLQGYMATFAVIEMVSMLIYVKVAKMIVEMTTKPVSAVLSVCALITATAAATVFEIVGYLFIWRMTARKSEVEREKETGKKSSFYDLLEGARKEFRPFRMFSRNNKSEPARTVNEEVGQIWGIIESYWLWIQALRFVVGALIVKVYHVMPCEFVDKIFEKTAQWGVVGIFNNILMALNWRAIDKKLEENNKHFYQETKSV